MAGALSTTWQPGSRRTTLRAILSSRWRHDDGKTSGAAGAGASHEEPGSADHADLVWGAESSRGPSGFGGECFHPLPAVCVLDVPGSLSRSPASAGTGIPGV